MFQKARLRAVVVFVLSIISEAKVNLQKLSLSGVAKVKPESVYKHFSRLMIWVVQAKIDFGSLILKLCKKADSCDLILCSVWPEIFKVLPTK